MIAYAEVGADELTIGLDLGEHAVDFGLIQGNREADALCAASDCGIDGEYLACEADEGAAAIAGIDGGVGLDELAELFGAAGAVVIGGDAAAHGGYHAHGDTIVELPERIAYGDDELADFDCVLIGYEGDGGEGFVAFWRNTDNGKIIYRITGNDFGGVFGTIGEYYGVLCRVGGDYVLIGEEEAVLGNNKARAGSSFLFFLLDLGLFRSGLLLLEAGEIEERIPHVAAAEEGEGALHDVLELLGFYYGYYAVPHVIGDRGYGVFGENGGCVCRGADGRGRRLGGGKILGEIPRAARPCAAAGENAYNEADADEFGK